MSNRHETLRHRAFAALLCLVLHLCANTPAGLLATATVAWLDGEHAVQLMGRESGSRIVLAHESSNELRSPTHSHCGTCRALLLMATPDLPGGPDHVLDFREPGVLARNGIAAAPPAPVLNFASVGSSPGGPFGHFTAATALDLRLPKPGCATVGAASLPGNHTPPVCLVSTKTTVLLI